MALIFNEEHNFKAMTADVIAALRENVTVYNIGAEDAYTNEEDA
jgi:hypothetical protein